MCGNYSREETTQGWKLLKGGNYMRKYGMWGIIVCTVLCNLSFIKKLYINGHNTSEDENPGLAWIRGSDHAANLMVQYLVNPSVITIFLDKTHQNLFCCSEIMPSTSRHTPPHYRDWWKKINWNNSALFSMRYIVSLEFLSPIFPSWIVELYSCRNSIF